MKRCPITYETISEAEDYSPRGLRLLSPQLKRLAHLELNQAQQRLEAVKRVGKMSVQGVQTKLSAQLKVKAGCFDLVDQAGHYILKPQSESYPELPENEALTMSMAAAINLDVPVHGLVYSQDETMTYFIKRFDRAFHNKKIAVEDFAQLSESATDEKYNSSMEKVAEIIHKYCSFPKIESVKLLKLSLFNFLIGNEDMHLKNFSLITRDQLVKLAPAYDLLNTTIAQPDTREELALPLRGKKSKLSKRDFLEYFALERLNLNEKIIADVLQEINQALPEWKELITRSFLSKPMQEKYVQLLQERSERLGLEFPSKRALP